MIDMDVRVAEDVEVAVVLDIYHLLVELSLVVVVDDSEYAYYLIIRIAPLLIDKPLPNHISN